MPSLDEYRAAARDRYARDGEIEFDDDPEVSFGSDSGVYVRAWVWVSDADTATAG